MVWSSSVNRLLNISLPYMGVIHQRPCDGLGYDDFHFHIEFYTPLRTATRLKYLAGSESGTGTSINDRLPEESAGRSARMPKKRREKRRLTRRLRRCTNWSFWRNTAT
jgi:UDPglucose--hexose-1-phosphate uridylyltransferase